MVDGKELGIIYVDFCWLVYFCFFYNCGNARVTCRLSVINCSFGGVIVLVNSSISVV